MEVFVSYDELHDYIGRHYDKDVSFAKAGEQEIRVTLVQSLLVVNKKISEDLHIDSVSEDSVSVSYKGGLVKGLVISAAIGYIRGKSADLNEAMTTEDGNRVNICLSKIEKLRSALDKIELRAISVEEAGIRITLALK
ncbi:MAG: hypothetical protein K2K97_07410 [Muribaculaceae bacterium]|nr:hypothetical protein [Muribaculaceae bacterium]